MAVKHLAYTFDPESFHSFLEARTVTQGQVQGDRLRQLAEDLLKQPSHDMVEALQRLRFDAEWLQLSTDEESRFGEQYAIVLAHHLKAAPSLGRSFPASYLTLREVLPECGWPDYKINLLLCGDSIRTLVKSSASEVIIGAFQSAGFGGWLDIEALQLLKQQLEEHADCFTGSATRLTPFLKQLAEINQIGTKELIGKAYDDGMKMLDTDLERAEPLYLILD